MAVLKGRKILRFSPRVKYNCFNYRSLKNIFLLSFLGRLKDKDGSKIFGNNNNNNHKNYLINLLKKTLEKEKGEFVKKIEADVTELSEQIVNTVESKALLGLEDSENVKEGSMNKSGM